MKNRLLALEKSVTHCRNKQTRGRKSPAAGSRQYPGGGRQARTLSVPVNYTVPGLVPALRQRDSMACWATVFTMLTSWKNDASFAIETALSAIGPKWLNLYTGNHGLSGTDKVEFVAAAGLIAEPPQNYSVYGWGNLLRTYGPLWVTTDEAPGRAWAIHARVITAINGDGTPAGTSFTIIDPASGRQYKERISVFVPKYEEEVRRTGYMRIQVLHWAQDARLSTGKSSSSSNVVAFQHNAYFGYPLGGKGNGNTAIVTPATPVSPVAPVDLDAVVARLIADGADETALMEFLSEIKAPLKGGISTQSRLALPLGVEPNATVNLPTGVVLEGAEAFAFKAAVSSALLVVPVVGPVMMTLFNLLPEVANRLDVTIGVGPAASGGIVGGGSLGAGILFAPGNKIGFYGSAGAILGAIASISATMQITVIKGGPSNFGGTAVLAGITVDTGVGPGIGAHAILSNGKFIGVTGEVGVTAGPSPFEAFSEFQYTATSMNLQRYAENFAAPVLFGSRASNYSETLYGTGEHVLAGEVNSSPISPTYALDVNGVDFTYGEIIAMGDLYETHAQMISAPKSELRKLKKLIVKSKQFHEGRIARRRPTGSDVKQGEWQRATKKRYIKLAEDNFSHFAPSSSYLIPNFSSTKTNNKKEWEHYHQKAIEKAMSGTSSLDLEQALVINAFGDHFLTDAFAAGHLVNKDAINAYFKSRVFNGSELNSNGEKMLDEIASKAFTGKLKSAFSKYETYEPHDAWWNIFKWNPNIHKVDRFKLLLAGIMNTEPDIIGKTLVAKLIHDALNKYPGGVAVIDSNGNHWKLTGDDSLDQTNLDIMREAVMQSIINIDDAAAGKNLSIAMMFGRVWEKVPIPTSGSKAMIKRLVKKYTNPLGSELTDGAARLLQRYFKDLLVELEDRNILKKA